MTKLCFNNIYKRVLNIFINMIDDDDEDAYDFSSSAFETKMCVHKLYVNLHGFSEEIATDLKTSIDEVYNKIDVNLLRKHSLFSYDENSYERMIQNIRLLIDLREFYIEYFEKYDLVKDCSTRGYNEYERLYEDMEKVLPNKIYEMLKHAKVFYLNYKNVFNSTVCSPINIKDIEFDAKNKVKYFEKLRYKDEYYNEFIVKALDNLLYQISIILNHYNSLSPYDENIGDEKIDANDKRNENYFSII